MQCCQQPDNPNHFDELRTRSGLARFSADMLHHLFIRHDVYGTSGIRLAVDPRINKAHVPKDGCICGKTGVATAALRWPRRERDTRS